MRRLYIGGLSHAITEKDLKDRFRKFGDVEDVELRTRRDEEGVPYKTFGYININISDADLKKCLTVLNKSKWKGGTLQIETAKESFLHRLAEERQAAAEQHLQQPTAEDKTPKLLHSLSKVGVDNFTMKAAVPGTEVPGHKDWVVSKFGRVLPILQLRCRKGNRVRTLKYDPSKYSHNIRKLDKTTADQFTPVTQLTWALPGGEDDISKKRRGEFPPYEPPRPKKYRTHTVNSYNAVVQNRLEPIVHTEAHQFTTAFERPTNHRMAQKRGPHLTDSDVDSDEEIRRLVAAQQTSPGAQWQGLEDDNLEVVGFDYLVKQQKGRPDEDDYDSADTDELLASRKAPPPLQEELSPPTAEHLSGKNTDRRRKTKKTSKASEQEEEEEDSSADSAEHLTSRKPSSSQQRGNSGKRNSQTQGNSTETQSKKMTVLPVLKLPFSESDSDEDDEDDEDVQSADSSSDSDYEAMFSNVTCLEISLADLQRLAKESQPTSETPAPSILGATPKLETNLTSSSVEQPAPKKGTLPEEILAAIMEEDSSEDEQKKKKKRKVVMSKLPAFQGTVALNEGSETDSCLKRQKKEDEGRGNAVRKQKLYSDTHQVNHRATDGKTSRCLSRQKLTGTEKKTPENSEQEEEEDDEERKKEAVRNMAAPNVLNMVLAKPAVHSEKAGPGSASSCDEEEEEEDKMKANQTVFIAKAAAKTLSSSCTEQGKDKQDDSAEDVVKTAPPPAAHSESSSSEEEEQAPRRVPLGAEEEEKRQRKANLRRLAAVQQRQKEAEEHKRLIRGALAKLDTPTAGAGKHVIFGSDDEEDEQVTTSEVKRSKKTLFQNSQSDDESSGNKALASEDSTMKEKVRLRPSAPQLFDGSEEDGDEEEDKNRFDIRPQFEGRAGQQLMELQSCFGVDSRFRMDTRFLDDDEDKEEESEGKRKVTEEDESLEEERKKNMSILQSIIGSSQQTCSSKMSGKAKTFRDISALHYDPTREEHAAFETKKESKAASKKREEVQKLPEISKEIYYDVSGDLKAVFGSTKNDVAGGEVKKSWDQEEKDESGKDEEPTVLSSLLWADPSAEKEASTGFKFSFFGDGTETKSRETDYKVESIQAPKVSWQQDPRLLDSSSEDDEEEQEEDEEDGSAAAKTTEETPPKLDLFFFYPDDSRLTEGPKLFCRSSQLEEQWEERRKELKQEYRKKHKDALRKLKSSQKS